MPPFRCHIDAAIFFADAFAFDADAAFFFVYMPRRVFVVAAFSLISSFSSLLTRRHAFHCFTLLLIQRFQMLLPPSPPCQLPMIFAYDVADAAMLRAMLPPLTPCCDAYMPCR